MALGDNNNQKQNSDDMQKWTGSRYKNYRHPEHKGSADENADKQRYFDDIEWLKDGVNFSLSTTIGEIMSGAAQLIRGNEDDDESDIFKSLAYMSVQDASADGVVEMLKQHDELWEAITAEVEESDD